VNKRYIFLVWLFAMVGLAAAAAATANGQDPGVNGRTGGHSVYGDIRVDENKVPGLKPINLDLILYTEGRTIISRQTVSSNGRYRFNNIPSGMYDVVVEVEGQEVARVKIDLTSPLIGDLRQDLAFAWKSIGAATSKASAISAADRYERGSENATLFEKAGAAIDKKRYDEGAGLLQRIVAADPKDFQAWTELANVHLLQEKYPEAETEYLRAIDLHADFFPALLNLGRVEVVQKKYDIAVEVLSRAIKARPESANANRLLGESYLQIKKGSLAVGYLKEALRLDPKGMADVHLRLALLYHGAGMKERAAAEYEEFLKKKPDYPDRKKLEKYIADNKKP
jgi:tetratricopeptide (TPR) repeat protein